jgi:hypothetical protein
VLRRGYVWVGVSAQKIGVEGGVGVVSVPGAPSGGLRGTDPARYGTLRHPGDAFALDIYSQVGRALRARGAVDALGGLRPERLLATGESQSAMQLVTYLNAVQGTSEVFDGFFVHSRGGGAAGLDGGIMAAITGGTRIRDDLRVPVLIFQTESDNTFLRYYEARQPDTDYIRLWDVAGAAHADAYVVGGAVELLGCKNRVNEAQTHYVAEAALRRLDEWVRSGEPPAPAPRTKMSLENGTITVHRDEHGNAIGGIRTPAVDAPVATLSGDAGDATNLLCRLFGSTTPFDEAKLSRLYPTTQAHRDAYARAADAAIRAGHVLEDDRAQILADAERIHIP